MLLIGLIGYRQLFYESEEQRSSASVIKFDHKPSRNGCAMQVHK